MVWEVISAVLCGAGEGDLGVDWPEPVHSSNVRFDRLLKISCERNVGLVGDGWCPEGGGGEWFSIVCWLG